MKAILKLITSSALIIVFINNAKSQNWQWGLNAGGALTDGAYIIIHDNSGNLYAGGNIYGSNCYFPIDTLNTNGGNDFYLAKITSTGNKLWVKQFGGYNFLPNQLCGSTDCCEGVTGLVFDSVSNTIYMLASFCGSALFDTISLNSSGWTDIALVKLDLNGICLWAKKVGGFGRDVSSGITIDGLGNIYFCGANSDSATFGSIKIPHGGFIAKYDSSGNCVWAKNKFPYHPISISFAPPHGIKVSNNNLFINGTTGLDTLVIDTITVPMASGFISTYLAEFDTGGTAKWVRLAGGPNPSSIGEEFGIDNSSNSFITGTFTAYGIFGNDTLHNGIQKDAFLAKYDIIGNMQWVQQLNASGGSYGYNVSSDGDGTIYFTGKFSGSAQFGSYNVTAGNLSGDMFIARYNSSGACLGVRNFGEACGYGITQDANGNPFVSGTFNNTVNIGGNTFTSHGMEDIFIAKLDVFKGIGEDESTINNQLLIYANPTQGKCNIKVPDDFVNEKNLVLSIYDNTGKLIQQKTLQMNDGKIKLSLDAEAKGIYNVMLSNGKKNYSGRIVFE